MKRRRPPSFKNKHRVAPKKVTSDLEADDEGAVEVHLHGLGGLIAEIEIADGFGVLNGELDVFGVGLPCWVVYCIVFGA